MKNILHLNIRHIAYDLVIFFIKVFCFTVFKISKLNFSHKLLSSFILIAATIYVISNKVITLLEARLIFIKNIHFLYYE